MDQRFILHELKDINNDYESKHIAQELCKHAFGGINIEAWESSCSEDRCKLDGSTELEGFGRWECQNIVLKHWPSWWNKPQSRSYHPLHGFGPFKDFNNSNRIEGTRYKPTEDLNTLLASSLLPG